MLAGDPEWPINARIRGYIPVRRCKLETDGAMFKLTPKEHLKRILLPFVRFLRLVLGTHRIQDAISLIESTEGRLALMDMSVQQQLTDISERLLTVEARLKALQTAQDFDRKLEP